MSYRNNMFAGVGYDPIATFTRIHGCPPAGMRQASGIVVVTQAERDRAGREFAEREQAEREATARERAEAEVKADDSPWDGEGAHDAQPHGGGAPSGEAGTGGCEEPPVPHPADGSPPHAGEELAGFLDTPADGSPSPAGENRDAETVRVMREWLQANWAGVEAMARAGVAPVPLLQGEGDRDAKRRGGVAQSDGADLEQSDQPPVPLHHPADGSPPRAGEELASPRPKPFHVAKGDRWNKPKMVDFLRQLAATHSVSAAAKSVGMSRESAYRLRNRLKGQPFDIAWEAAFRQGYDNLAHAALDRAINGVEVPHYANGELVGTSRKYDERLTVAMLAMRNRYGAPLMGRYGAAAEWWSERWDAMLQRVGTGPVDWQDEERALDQEKHVAALIAKHAPDDGPANPRRR